MKKIIAIFALLALIFTNYVNADCKEDLVWITKCPKSRSPEFSTKTRCQKKAEEHFNFDDACKNMCHDKKKYFTGYRYDASRSDKSYEYIRNMCQCCTTQDFFDAIKNGDLKKVQGMVLKGGLDVNVTHETTSDPALVHTIKVKDQENYWSWMLGKNSAIQKFLLDQGADPDQANDDGQTYTIIVGD